MRSVVICAVLLTACRDHVDADFSDELKVMAIDRLVFADPLLVVVRLTAIR